MENRPPTIISADSERFRSIVARHKAFWERAPENSFLRSIGVDDATSAPLALRQPDGSYISQVDRLQPDMLDPAALIQEVEHWEPGPLEPTMPPQGRFMASFGRGDTAPFSLPNAKVPWIEAMLGCPVRMVGDSIWAEQYPGDPQELIERPPNIERSPWFQLYLEFLRQFQERIGDRFPPTGNAFRGPADLVVAILGVEETCIGWVERPAFMARLMRVCTDARLAMSEAFCKVVKPFHDGYMSPGSWTSAPVVYTQCDHSVLLSAEMYREQILPYDLEVIRCCPLSYFHTHSGGIRILPVLVEIPELDVIQVSIDPSPTGGLTPREVEMLQMVLEHKPLETGTESPEEAERLLAQLPRRGLSFSMRFGPATHESLLADSPAAETWLFA